MASDTKSSPDPPPLLTDSMAATTSISGIADETGLEEEDSKGSTLVDDTSLSERDIALDNSSEMTEDDNRNFTSSLQPRSSKKFNGLPEGDGDHIQPTFIISSNEASSSSYSSKNSGPVGISTPKRSSSPTTIISESNNTTKTPIPQMTSTPISTGPSGATDPNVIPQPSTSSGIINVRPQSLSVRLKNPDPSRDSLTDSTEDTVNNTSFTSQASAHTTTHESQTDLDLYDVIQVPIIGYETMEERSRFTVFKMRVQKSAEEGWYIFRRYSDFVRLNETLKTVFPHFRLALPPKKWFGDNYDQRFLEERLVGLQAFLNNVISHRDVCNSEAVRDFLCIDDPPGPHDSLEESRALCELLEDQTYTLRQELQSRDARIALLEEELSLYKAEVDNLRRALRMERAMNTHRRCSPSQRSESSITEHDEASEVEADQQPPLPEKPSANSSLLTSPEGASSISWDVISDTSREHKSSQSSDLALGSTTLDASLKSSKITAVLADTQAIISSQSSQNNVSQGLATESVNTAGVNGRSSTALSAVVS